jgi:protease-4
VRRLMDRGPFLPEEALRAGLVDDVVYEDQVDDKLGGGRNGRHVEGDDYARVTATSLGLNAGPRIAVIYAAGTINGGRSGYDPIEGAVIGSDTLNEYIRQARHDGRVRAIVLRIDSPGGSASASDAVWRELMIARNERADRPLIASMSDLAASGGYYIAMPAQVIVAQPSTLTGSIGIVGGKFVTGGVYEKLGARIESTSIGRHAEINSPARPYTPDELQKLHEQLQAFYDQFVEKAAESRHMQPEKIDAIAQGRVWTGRQAKQNGLVDQLGGLDRAIAVAKQRAKIPVESEVELVVYPPRKSFYELVSQQFSGSTEQMAVGRWMAANLTKGELEALRMLRGPMAIFHRGEPLALMPFTYLR